MSKRARPRGGVASPTAKQAYKMRDRVKYKGRWYLSPRKAARRARVSQVTLAIWETNCPWRGEGKGIETQQLETAFGRTITYYLEDHIDEVVRAKAERESVPEFPGLVYITTAATDLGYSIRTLRRRMKASGVKVVEKSAKSKDGRALPRAYVPRTFVDACAAETKSAAKLPEEKQSIREAASLLGLSVAGVHDLIRYGVLLAEDGRIVCNGGYPRKAKVLSKAEVERYRKQKNGEVTPEPYTDREKNTWLPRPLALEQHPRVKNSDLLKSTNKPHPSCGVVVRAKPIKWPNGFRFHKRPRPLGFLEADLVKLDRALGGTGEEAPTNGNGQGEHFRATPPDPGAENLTPRWDRDRRALWYGKECIRSFGVQPADSQVTLCEAFEKAGWPTRIDNPFTTLGSAGRVLPNNDKLHNTCKNLNKSLSPARIHFERDGTGHGVRWELC